jgi:hypothetical protein
MNADFCSSMLRGLSGINLSERERARAEDRVRKSVAFVEWLVAIAGAAGRRADEAKQRA